MLKKESGKLRAIEVNKNWNKWAEGSAFVNWGNNIVAVTASIEKRVPPHLLGTNQGWLAVEYRMLPRASDKRKIRNENRIVTDARQIEISRLLGRLLRNTVDLMTIPKKTIWIDCDIIQADGGTRIASLLGGFIALYEVLKTLRSQSFFTNIPINYYIAGVSAIIKEGKIIFDPDYEQDSAAEVDLNIIMNSENKLLEIQGGSEGTPYSEDKLMEVIKEAKTIIAGLISFEKEVIETDPIL